MNLILPKTVDEAVNDLLSTAFKSIRNTILKIKYNGEDKPTVVFEVNSIVIEGRDGADLPITKPLVESVDLTASLPDSYCWTEVGSPNSVAVGSFSSWSEFVNRYDGLIARVNGFVKSIDTTLEVIQES